jgi:hypothetical protein
MDSGGHGRRRATDWRGRYAPFDMFVIMRFYWYATLSCDGLKGEIMLIMFVLFSFLGGHLA